MSVILLHPYPSGGGETRAYDFRDAPTKSMTWADLQDASSLAYDATTKRFSSIANKGTAGGSFTPSPAATNAATYNATAFNGALPAAVFNSNDPDMMVLATAVVNQPATGVYVWQEGASFKGYEVVVDHDTNASGNRQQLFTTYGGGPVFLVRGPVNGVETNVSVGTGNQAANRINILIVEYNGASSRVYYNGGLTTGYNLGSALINTGITIGAKRGDGATYFGGKFGELAIFPAIFTGDDWDRITQSTMWKWGQQANIATGATYKTDAPMVPA